MNLSLSDAYSFFSSSASRMSISMCGAKNTRIFSSPRFSRRLQALCFMIRMTCTAPTEVIPLLCATSMKIFIIFSSSSGEASRALRVTISMAGCSRKNPVGSPFSSLSMIPPCGVGVSLSMPQSSIVLLFTQTACSSLLNAMTGRSGKYLSRASFDGNASPGHL